MTLATKQYRERMHRNAETSADRWDPEKMLASLTLQGVRFTKIQMRTLLFDDRAQLDRLKVTNPELAQVFILLVREDLETPALDNSPVMGESD